MGGGSYRYLLALLGTVVLWGSSFPVIKFLMGSVDEYSYVWIRGFLSVLFLLPVISYYGYRQGFSLECVKGGLLSGVFYSLGLFFQGWGTAYTTASNSAFITGLNVLFVHVFVALKYRRYSMSLLIGLVLGLTGLFLISNPSVPGRIGDLLVLIGAIMWAGQIPVFDKYSGCSPYVLVFFMFLPTLLYKNPLEAVQTINKLTTLQILGFTYLSLFCSIAAFTLQAYGQKKTPPETTVTIFLLEPVLATIFSHITLKETLTPQQILGATTILTAIYTTQRNGGGAPTK